MPPTPNATFNHRPVPAGRCFFQCAVFIRLHGCGVSYGTGVGAGYGGVWLPPRGRSGVWEKWCSL